MKSSVSNRALLTTDAQVQAENKTQDSEMDFVVEPKLTCFTFLIADTFIHSYF